MSGVNVFRASDWTDVLTIQRLLLRMHEESGLAPASNEKGMQRIASVVMQEVAWIVEDAENDEPIGTMGLYETDFWYSDETYLADAWLYVVPERRFENAGRRFLELASAEAERRGKLLIITITNPHRRASPSKVGRIAESMLYRPVGGVLRLGPRGA